MKILITLLSFLFIISANAQTVTHLKGKVFVNKEQAVKVGSKIEWNSSVYSDDPSAYIKIKTDKSQLILTSKFRMELKEPANNVSKVNLLYGKIRALVDSKKDKKQKYEVTTPTAVAGVRGTDFFLSYLPLLGESEIICFEGLVDFGLQKNKPTKVKAGQWGGVGGRFGNKVGKPLDLPQNVLEHFQNSLPVEN